MSEIEIDRNTPKKYQVYKYDRKAKERVLVSPFPELFEDCKV